MRIGSILTLHRHRPRVLVSAGLLREVPALQRLAGLLGGLSSPLADRRGEPMSGNRLLDSYRFIRKQEYFNKFMQLVGVGGCFGWSGRLYGRPIRVCCWAVVLQRVDGERGCWRGARRVVCERE